MPSHPLFLRLVLIAALLACAPGAMAARRSEPRVPVDGSALPVLPVKQVLADADRDTVPDRKGDIVKVRGVVTVPTGILRQRGFQVLIQDETGGVGLFNRGESLTLEPGDVVEAHGEISQYKGAVQLQDAQVTVIGRRAVPEALVIPTAEADGWRHMGRRIRVEGVTGTLTLDSYGLLRLTGDDGGVVSIFIPASVTDRFDWKNIPRGTRVAATGVLSVFKPSWPYDGGFQVIVSGPADLAVLQPPAPTLPTWVFWAAGGTAGTLLLSMLGFALFQRRQRARERELKTLSALSNAFAVGDLSDAQLARQACEILTAYGIAEAAMVQAFDERGGLHQIAVATADPRFGDVLAPGESLSSGDVSSDAHGHQMAARFADKGLSLLAVHPLLAPSGSLGFLVALSPRKRKPTEMQERTLLSAVKLLAMALENSRIQQRARQEQHELQQLVITDELTRLCNRRFLEEYLRVQIPLARRRGGGLAFLAIDIDHFKHVNDTYGHEAGDRVLAGIAGLLRQASRSSDLPVRVGGEEFLFVVAEHEIDGALAFAERLRAAVEGESFDIGADAPLRVTISVGVAMFGLHGDDGASLLRASDEAMYASKRNGRNRVTLSTRLDWAGQPAEQVHDTGRDA